MIKVTLDGIPNNGLVFETTLITATLSSDGEDLRSVMYQWLVDGQIVATSTANQAIPNKFRAEDADVGKAVTVNLVYSDAAGVEHKVAGANSLTVLDVENRPQGSLDVVSAEKAQYLFLAGNNLRDEDGMGTVSYQWKVDGQAIPGATGTEFTATPEQSTRHIEVVASWIDGRGHAESVSSDDKLYLSLNAWGTAGVTGTFAPGQALHAAVTDPDGLGKVYYGWETSTDGKTWTAQPGATSQDFAVGANAPELLRARVMYADNHGFVEDHRIVLGGPGADTVALNAGDTINLGAGNDTILEAGGTLTTVDGGAGVDTFVGAGLYMLHTPGEGVGTIRLWNEGGYGAGLVNVERVVLGTTGTAFDTDGAAGQAYRLYQAAFDRTPDNFGIGFWISQLDKGIPLLDVADAFVGSAEFKDKYAKATTNAALVDQFYANILHRAPDATGQAFWTGVLDKHQASLADVLVHFSESPENVAALVGTIQDGISYLPYTGH
ncbi:hypothetical protein C5614_08730 [Massilia phosphatilytica]|nr:hypothetical protein C5614_08730 [Massilia phosphatilytica]